MPLLLLDQNAPLGLRSRLPGFDVRSALSMGWDRLVNGRLLAAAEEAGFDGMITCDQRIVVQQNLTGRRLALIVLDTGLWPLIAPHVDLVVEALKCLEPGAYIPAAFPRPPLKRRVFIPGGDPPA